MNSLRYHILFAVLLFGLELVAPHQAQAQSTWGELSVIGNKIGLAQLNAEQARNLFRAKTTTWPNKLSVTIALPSPKSPSSELVARIIYGTRPSSVQKFWLSLVFQGRATPPNFFDTDQELIQFLQRTPGSIGVVSSTTPLPNTVLLIPIQQ